MDSVWMERLLNLTDNMNWIWQIVWLKGYGSKLRDDVITWWLYIISLFYRERLFYVEHICQHNKYSSIWMYYIINRWMGWGQEGGREGWMNKWLDGYMDRWMEGGREGWREAWMDGWIDGWMDWESEGGRDEWINGWMDGGREGGMEGGMDGWMDWWLDGLREGGREGWMDE